MLKALLFKTLLAKALPYLKKVLLCGLAIIISSCATSRSVSSQNDLNNVFHTLITENNVKRFELTLKRKKRLALIAPNPNSPKQPSTPRGYSEKQLIKTLNNALQYSGYCKEGYLLLGRYAGKKTNNRLRGECRDKASEEDKKAFPNTIEAW